MTSPDIDLDPADDDLSLLGGPRCTATSKATGERCKNPARKNLPVCRNHGGNTPMSQAAAARRQEERDKMAMLEQSGFFNPDAPTVTDPVEAFAKHVGKVAWQHDFLGDQINNTQDCPCCGRLEWDPTILRELRTTSQELGKYLDQMIKHGIEDRRVQLEEFKIVLIVEGLRAGLEAAGVSDEKDEAVFFAARAAAIARVQELGERGFVYKKREPVAGALSVRQVHEEQASEIL